MSTVLTASSDGSIVGYFDIPANVPMGSKDVVFTGVLQQGTAEFVGRGSILTTELRRVASITTQRYIHLDPVAQTFQDEIPHMIGGIAVQFCAKGNTPVVCELRETSLGFPTETVLANAVLYGDDVDLTPGVWTRFTWPPVPWEAGREYCFVLLCDDDIWAVRIATLGEWDYSVPQLVTEQPYTVGVLLKSSNNISWSIDQLSDITFQILGPTYPITTRLVEICSASATESDLIVVSAVVERPAEGTDLKFQIVTTVSTYTAYENLPVLLPAPYTGPVTVYASLTGDSNASPYMHSDLTVMCGKGLSTGSYITRTVPCASSGGTCRATFNMTAYAVSNSSITVSAQNGVTGGGDPIWSDPFDVARDDDIGDNWYDRTYTQSGLTVTSTRFKVVLEGTPRHPALARNLQAYCIETT